MPQTEDTRLRKAARWGLYGGAGGVAVGGLAGLAMTKNLPISLVGGIHTGLRTGLIGAGLGALTYRRPYRKRVQELSSRLDDVIYFYQAHKLKEGAEPLVEKTRDKLAEGALENVLHKIKKSGRIRLSSMLDELIEFTADPRPRNLQGEFERQGEGGPDPNAMARVYKMPQPQPSSTISAGKFAGAAFAGGALGSIGAQAGKSAWNQTRRIVKRLASKRKSVLVK